MMGVNAQQWMHGFKSNLKVSAWDQYLIKNSCVAQCHSYWDMHNWNIQSEWLVIIISVLLIPLQQLIFSLVVLIPNIHLGGLGDPKMCIDIPTTPPLKSLYVVWPGDAADTDCICPLCDSANCVWNNCQCSNNYSSFITIPELHVNATILNGIKNSIYSLCWPNLQIELNNTAIHFFYEERSCIGSINQTLPSFLSRKYVRNDKIILYGKLFE